MINIVSIVGASGFIGREVVDYFIENKIIVKILIDSQSKLLNFKKSDYIICYEKSPFDEDIPIEFFESDALINCFGSINGISSIYRNNILVPQNLINQGFKKIKKIIQISSVSVYDFEDNLDIIDENSKISPQNIYELSKAISETIILNLTEKHNIKCVILRASNVVGANMKNNSFRQLINLVKKGIFFYVHKDDYISNYLNVKDLANAIFKCSILSNANGIYNLSDDCTYKKLIGIITKSLKIKSRKKILPINIAYLICVIFKLFRINLLTKSRIKHLTNKKRINIRKIKKEIGYEIVYGLEDAVSKIIKSNL